jgi:hypothetical protein
MCVCVCVCVCVYVCVFVMREYCSKGLLHEKAIDPLDRYYRQQEERYLCIIR